MESTLVQYSLPYELYRGVWFLMTNLYILIVVTKLINKEPGPACMHWDSHVPPAALHLLGITRHRPRSSKGRVTWIGSAIAGAAASKFSLLLPRAPTNSG